MVAVVDEAELFVNVMEMVLDDQFQNWLPELADAFIASEPAFSHTFVPDGVVEPVPDGATAKDTWYCVVQPAVSVIGLFIVTEPEDAVPVYPPVLLLDHPLKTYCVPVPPATVVGVKLIVTFDPALYQPAPVAVP